MSVDVLVCVSTTSGRVPVRVCACLYGRVYSVYTHVCMHACQRVGSRGGMTQVAALSLCQVGDPETVAILFVLGLSPVRFIFLELK